MNDAPYTFDANGNLLSTGVMTNVWDAANRLTEVSRNNYTLRPIYNGLGDRVAQVSNGITTTFALDVQGLPEVIYTTPSTSSGQAGNAYPHLPGVIVAEKAGETRYLPGDGLGSVRQAIDELGAVVAYHEFDPYGNPIRHSQIRPFAFTGEWWQDEVALLHLRARWYSPGTGRFLSVDSVEGEPPYLYIGGNVVNRVDPSGLYPVRGCDNHCNGKSI